MSLKNDIKQDERVRRSLRRLKSTQLDLDALQTELMTMHSSRATRALRSSKLLSSSTRILVDATALDMGYRSRAVEIQVIVLSEMLARDEILSALRKYILSRFVEQLKTSFKTVTAQRAYIDVLLESQLAVSKTMSHVLQVAKLIVDDIDQAGWGLKLIKETLEAQNKERYH